MPKRGEIYSALRESGFTYEAIGKVYGVSKQAVQNAIARYNNGPYLTEVSEAAIRKIKYKGLAKWMLDNRITFAELERQSGITKLYMSLIKEHEPGKKTIDRILAVTGMTYEECFKE